jgi:hypothetical protein
LSGTQEKRPEFATESLVFQEKGPEAAGSWHQNGGSWQKGQDEMN